MTCNGSGMRVLEEDTVYVSGDYYLNVRDYVVEDEHTCDMILTEESVYCRYSDITTHQDYARELYNDEYEIPDNVVELHDGRLASTEDDNVVELTDGRWCLDHETTLNEDGDLVLTSEYESANQ
jgi:hypothetical protein